MTNNAKILGGLSILYIGILIYIVMKKTTKKIVIATIYDLPESVFNMIEFFETSGQPLGKKSDGLYYSYPDSAGYDTIGIGHLNIENLQGLTAEKIRDLFKKDLTFAFVKIKTMIKNDVWNDLSGNQIGALLSFQFNTGASGSQLYQLINQRKWNDADVFWRNHYITSKGVFYQGLQNRRNKEADTFKKDL